jgi:hypothetical protein
MRKIAVLLAIFYIISPKIFTDEFYDEIGGHRFPWQLNNYYSGNSGDILLKQLYFTNDVYDNGVDNNVVDVNFFTDTRNISYFEHLYLNNGKTGYTLGMSLYIPFIKEEDTKDFSFLDHLEMNSGKAGYMAGAYFYSLFKTLDFLDKITGGPERRRREELEENNRYNILNPTEPRKPTR